MERSERIDAYLRALDVPPGAPDLELLARLIARHLETFAFASIGPHLGEPLPLDPDAVFDRVVVRRRGGYCFEHNLLLFDALESLGYSCRLMMARVVLRTDDAPLDHRVTLVTLGDEVFVADVGMGWPTPVVPVPMSGAIVGDGWRSFRVIELRPGHFTMQSSRGDDWRSLYRFELAEYSDADCEVAHLSTSRNPQSQFVQHLIASLILPSQTRSLRDRSYQVATPDESLDLEVTSAAELEVLLSQELGINVSRAECARLWELMP